MLKRVLMVLALAGFAAFTAQPVEAADGEKVWKKCRTCHVYDSNQKKVGPTLQGLFGRKCGTAPKYTHGKDYIKACGAKPWSWDKALLDEYLTDPKAFIKARGGKRSKMVLKLKKPAERKAIIAFLEANAK